MTPPKPSNGYTWSSTLLTSILLVLIGFGLPGLYYVGRQVEAVEGMRVEMSTMRSEVQQLNTKVTNVVVTDISDLRQRLGKWEAMGMLPLTKVELTDLDKRLDRVEADLKVLKERK
jgi:hypothetical protein